MPIGSYFQPTWLVRRGRLVPFGAGALAAIALAGVTLGAGQAGPALAAADQAAAEPASSGGPLAFRRLSEAQYKRSIQDIFGADIKVPGRFDPEVREEGLLAIGSGQVGISSSGLEQVELRARDIAAQVLAQPAREKHLDCAPSKPSAFDKACATAFLSKYGRLLYRRPLTHPELVSVLTVTGAAVDRTGDFHKGLEVGLARLLYSPNFIFRVERSEPDPARPGAQRLDSYSLASRISFLLWNAPPDEALLSAAQSGALRQPAELQRQVDRLIASPNFANGVRAYFSDMLGFNQFDGLTRDQEVFPKFTSTLANDAREQALLTIVDLLVTNNGDYRDLFTTRRTYLNRNLGALYEIPIEDDVGVEGWMPYTFTEQDRRAGILTLAGLLMLDPTHEVRSSPTNRGKLVREALMCQKVPDPPGDVDFAAVQDINSKIHRTARQRLTVHMDNPVCAGCHKITDPIGLALETYDAVGDVRTHENDTPIDASGEFEGKAYKDVFELANLLHDSPDIPACLVQRTYEYGVGRSATTSEEAWLDYAMEGFAADKYQFPALLRRIATSRSFQAVSSTTVAAK
jgi:hypothetical protein